MKKYSAILAALALPIILVSSVAAATIYQDDFSTNPFTNRWSWSGSGAWFDYSAADQNAIFWASGTGGVEAKSLGVAPVVTAPYSVSIDFRADYNITTNGISLWANRQANDAHYGVTLYPGGSGQCLLFTSGGLQGDAGWSANALETNKWYTFSLDVSYDAATSYVAASVKDTATSTYVIAPFTFTDSSATRLVSNQGYAFGASTGLPPYVPFTSLDNFQVNAVPEPASLIALATGLIGLIARRRR